MNIPRLLRLAVIFIAAQLLGCSYQQQIEEVAKNWCMTIRASQVIPVYPLTEDLEPGDVFLVQTPVPRQAEQYKQKGFLPLDMHMVRLDISRNEFLEFYDNSYGLDPNNEPNVPPHIWQDKPKSNNDSNESEVIKKPVKVKKPVEVKKPEEVKKLADVNKPAVVNKPKDVNKPGEVKKPNYKKGAEKTKPAKHRDPTNWHKAPRAGFPSYTFNVERGAAGAAALPIKGIPLAMSLLGTDKATGSVTIKDSYTYGVPYDNLVQKLSIWAWENKDLLKGVRKGVIDAEPFPDQLWRFLSSPFVGHRERTIYLRIISRVYLTGSLTVSMTNTSAAAVKAATESFKDMSLPSLSSAEDINDNTKRLKALNESLTLKHLDTEKDTRGIGAAFNVTWATFRSVSLDERFDRPLVIGYLAFDFPVLEGGTLGTPIATLNQISKAPIPTKDERLSPESTVILAGMSQRLYDDLEKLGKTSTKARSHLKNLKKAATAILSTHYIPDYEYSFMGPNTLERTSFEIPSKVNVLTLASRLKLYRDCGTAMTKAIAALKKGYSLKVVDHDDKELAILDAGKPLEIQGQEIAYDGLLWLRKQRDSFITQGEKLDEQIQTSPEIIRAVDYYFSLFRPNR